MNRFSGCLIALAASAILAGCGGGGGGGNNSGPPKGPSVANTSLSYYLPLAQGNSWTFASGGKMQDLGSATLPCTCPANGAQVERIGIYSPGSSAVSASFFFMKTPPSGQFGRLSNMIGVENDAYTNNITVASDSTYPNGMPVMDDNPSVNEFWSDAGGTSTITSVGGTMTIPNNQEVIDIAVDQITGSFSPITWSFAKGVGFTQIGVGSQSTTITSFSVNTSTSQSAGRRPDSVVQHFTATRTANRLEVAPMLDKLF